MSPDRDVRRTRRRGGHRRPRARAAHARVRVQHAARRQVDRRPAAPLPTAGSRAGTSRNEASDESVRRARRRGAGALRHPATLVLAEGAAARARPASPTTTAWRRSRRSTRSSAGPRPASSCSTRTRRSRPTSPSSPSGSSTSRGSTRRSGPGSGRARSARTPCRASTRTCCSTGRRAGATCSRSRTRWATGCTRTSRASRGSSTRPRRSRWPRPRRCSARRSPSVGCSTPPTIPRRGSALLAESLEGQIATVFRQVAMNRFEDRVHTQRRDEGELSIEQFNEAWADTQHAMLGDTVEITEGYRTWWSYIPHFMGTPGLRVRVLVRAAARAVGVPRVRAAGRRRSCRSTSSCSRRAARARREELGRDRRPRPRRPRRSGTAGSRSSPSSSPRPRPRPRRPVGCNRAMSTP